MLTEARRRINTRRLNRKMAIRRNSRKENNVGPEMGVSMSNDLVKNMSI
jgi:hypothetical protein